MEKTKTFFVVIFWLVIPLVPYCQNISIESRAATMESARLDLTSDTLKEINMDAFEQRGIQKIKDFNNYIQIITDQSYDQSLRDHASTLALQLFINNQASINNKILVKNKNANTIDKWLEMLKQEQFESLKITINSIEIKQKLIYYEEGVYRGSILYHVTYSKSTKGAPEKIEQAIVLAEINLKQVEEKIGDNSIKAWKVFLSAIK